MFVGDVLLDAKVLACADEPACVRVDNLRLSGRREYLSLDCLKQTRTAFRVDRLELLHEIEMSSAPQSLRQLPAGYARVDVSAF